uniref:Uncharacterized protein n=1 Tax=Callorhinchus milii TaxID=7868 RepID=A0A4W3IYQ7_CALMI
MSVPVLPESCSHVLTELDWLDPLLSAIRLDSNRLKCTCVSMSRKWLALGSSAGGLHLIQKEGWKQRLMLTHKVRVRWVGGAQPTGTCPCVSHRALTQSCCLSLPQWEGGRVE